MRSVVFPFVILMLISACTVTRKSLDNHTDVIPYNDREAEITVKGLQYDSPNEVKKLAIIAASRYCLENEYDYFAIITEQSDQELKDVQLIEPSVTVREDGYGALRAEYDDGATFTHQRSTNELYIYMLSKEEYHSMDSRAGFKIIDAHMIKKELDKTKFEKPKEPATNGEKAFIILLITGGAATAIFTSL